MTSSLVGSEMCIRDRRSPREACTEVWACFVVVVILGISSVANSGSKSVSYTHLTLPTICSV
eukprot:5560375-Prorocentrum_lima.AAC.1